MVGDSVTQAEVDEVRTRVTLTWVRAMLQAGEDPSKMEQKYLWFPRDDVEAYELRDGNAPGNSDRPAHLRFLELWMDPKVNQEVKNFLAPGGGLDTYVLEKVDQKSEDRGKRLTDLEQQIVITWAIASYSKKMMNPSRIVAMQ